MKTIELLLCVVVMTGWCFVGCENPSTKSAASRDSAEAKNVEAKNTGGEDVEAKNVEAKNVAGENVAGEKVDASKKTIEAEPAYITVQHCLIAFRGTLPDKPITRSKEEAKELAVQLLEKLRAGADFEEIIRDNTDDSPPGIYKMANYGSLADRRSEIFGRAEMVAAFGDTGFPLQVGEFGLAEYDPKTSPFGWHIVKRIK